MKTILIAFTVVLSSCSAGHYYFGESKTDLTKTLNRAKINYDLITLDKYKAYVNEQVTDYFIFRNDSLVDVDMKLN
jgi:hypothetical protein